MTRWLGFGVCMVSSMVLYSQPLRELFSLSRHSELHSHAPLIPLVSLYLLFAERHHIFPRAGYALAVGLPVVIAGIALLAANGLVHGVPAGGDRLPVVMLAFWLSTVGGFLTFFGMVASRAAAFPLAFLAFMIPLPAAWVERFVALLCGGSGAFTDWFFQALGVTFLREGSIFHLGRVSIEIAPECSGIRSSLALFITATLAAKLMLRSWWGRGFLLLAVIPLAMVKNAIRIVTLTLLAEYVDMRFLTGHWLHSSGGFVFFGITLVLFGGILLVLRKMESGRSVTAPRDAPAKT